MVHCHIEANPEIQFVTWTKDNRLYDPFEIPGLMAMENGSILIDLVSAAESHILLFTPPRSHRMLNENKA